MAASAHEPPGAAKHRAAWERRLATILERTVRPLVTPALVAEHRRSPFGPHSTALAVVTQFLERNGDASRPRLALLRAQPDAPFQVVEIVRGRERSVRVRPGVAFATRAEAEHALFLLRLAEHGVEVGA